MCNSTKWIALVIFSSLAFFAGAVINASSLIQEPTELLADIPTPAKVVLPHMTDAWSSVLLQEISNNFVKLEKAKEDFKSFCPNYDSLSRDKRVLAWGFLATAMIEFESGINSRTNLFNQCSALKESTGQDSLGFFQLSYHDRFCPPDKETANLCEPNVNLLCGVRLMGEFTSQDRVVARGGYVRYGAPTPHGLSRYWSVLRVNDKKSKHHLLDIKNRVRIACLGLVRSS